MTRAIVFQKRIVTLRAGVPRTNGPSDHHLLGAVSYRTVFYVVARPCGTIPHLPAAIGCPLGESTISNRTGVVHYAGPGQINLSVSIDRRRGPMIKFLVTGATGFIGARVVANLQQRHIPVVAADYHPDAAVVAKL